MPSESRSADHESEQTSASAKKAYHKPVLTEYGSISKLTRTGGSTRAEPGSPSTKRKGITCL
jgi:hypothetical protein